MDVTNSIDGVTRLRSAGLYPSVPASWQRGAHASRSCRAPSQSPLPVERWSELHTLLDTYPMYRDTNLTGCQAFKRRRYSDGPSASIEDATGTSLDPPHPARDHRNSRGTVNKMVDEAWSPQLHHRASGRPDQHAGGWWCPIVSCT